MTTSNYHNKSLGQVIRELREAKGLTLRKLAQIISVSPTFLSKIERDDPGAKPSEETIKHIAQELGQDVDLFLAMAGRVSTELQQIIREQPQAMASFLRTARGKPPQKIEQITRELKNDP